MASCLNGGRLMMGAWLDRYRKCSAYNTKDRKVDEKPHETGDIKNKFLDGSTKKNR